MRVLITGADGFIGLHLVAELSPRHDVVAVVRRLPRNPQSAEYVVQDLVEPLDLSALPARIDAVIHLAQSRLYRDFPAGAADIVAVNIDSTFHLLEYARHAAARTFIFASTGGVYAHAYEKLVETDPVSPLNFYLTSKYAAELLTANYREFFHTVVFRFFFVYGKGQGPMLLPSLLTRVRAGQPVVVEGSRGLRLNPIHVTDAVRVFEPALTLDASDVFNVAGDEVVGITELIGLLAAAVGVEARVEHIHGEVNRDLVGDNSRMKDILGVSPRISLREGIAGLI